jgi:hypothetical protein
MRTPFQAKLLENYPDMRSVKKERGAETSFHLTTASLNGQGINAMLAISSKRENS